MPEKGGANIEIAHKLNEAGHHRHHDSRTDEIVEIIEAVVLALVAVATAWSGYQAARWEAHRAQLYERATNTRVAAEGLAVLGGQERIYDINLFSSWINAKSRGDAKLAELFERRFRDEYRLAFDSWQKTDPFHNPHAPPGPIFMSDYRNANNDKAADLSRESERIFKEGTESGRTGDDYVRITVFLATVLLITAISQRFRIRAVRTALLAIALLLLCIPLWSLLTLPRI